MEVLLVLVQGSLEALCSVVSLVVVIMGVVEEKDKLMAQTPSSWVLSWEDQEEAATVVGGEDKHQEKINLGQDSSGWRICLEEGTITAVIVPQHTTTTIMDTTVGTTTGITTDTTTDTTVGLILEVVDTTVDTTLPTGVSVTTD